MNDKRKKKAAGLKNLVMGVAWYSSAEWERMRAAVSDPEKLEDTYEEWESMALAALEQLEETGIIPERVPVQAEEFLAWCRENSREPDSGARAHFAAEKLRQRDLRKA